MCFMINSIKFFMGRVYCVIFVSLHPSLQVYQIYESILIIKGIGNFVEAGLNFYDGYKYTLIISILHCLLLSALCIKVRISTAKKDDPRIYRAILVYPAKSGMMGIVGVGQTMTTIQSAMDLGDFRL